MNATKDEPTTIGYRYPKAVWAEVERQHAKISEEFQVRLERLMEARGIEDLEELHRRYVETEYAHVPVPGLHRDKPVSLELFRRLTHQREPRYIYVELLHGLREALELTEEEFRELSWVYIWGEPPPPELRQVLSR